MKLYIKLVLTLIFTTISLHGVSAQDVGTKEKPIYLYNSYQGPDRVLTYAGENQPVVMAKKEEGNTAQMWYIETVEGTIFPKFKNVGAGPNQCLDVVSEKLAEYGGLSKVGMADCGNYSGQFWDMKVTIEGLQLSTQFQGTERLLDCDGLIDGSIVGLMDKANVSGQTWNIQAVKQKTEEFNPTTVTTLTYTGTENWNKLNEIKMINVYQIDKNNKCNYQTTLKVLGALPEDINFVFFQNDREFGKFKILGINEIGYYYYEKQFLKSESCNSKIDTETQNRYNNMFVEIQDKEGNVIGKRLQINSTFFQRFIGRE